MEAGTSRVSHDNEALESPEKQDEASPASAKQIVTGDPAAGGVAEDEDVDETLAGGLEYPDESGKAGR